MSLSGISDGVLTPREATRLPWISVCMFVLLTFFSDTRRPERESVCHSGTCVHLKALNPTQHWLNLLSSLLFISITTEIKFTRVFLFFSFRLKKRRKRNGIGSTPLSSERETENKRKVFERAEKEYFPRQPNHNEILSDSGRRKLYRNKKSDVIIYHLKPELFMRQKQNEILG